MGLWVVFQGTSGSELASALMEANQKFTRGYRRACR